MSIRLRDLIKVVRSCKTAAEERAVIAKECAAIRTAFKDEDSENRHRNVAKLLYIHMLGYPTHFGQMECLKLIVSPFYADKRIGYLGLMLLLDERQEVLMLVTNSLKNDLNHPNQFVVGLALCSLGNISTQGMARDCAPEVEKLLASTNSYVRKKAALCAIRIARKVPELLENFVSRTKALLNERNHGVLLTGVTLMIELCESDPANVDYYRKQQVVPVLVRLLKNLVLSGYAPEHDVSGITDPFLQVKILKFLRILGKGDAEASDQMNDILAQVATNTESTKNVGNAILYEAVQTIMSIESESGLKVMAINILGRFLLNRDNNIRYVALNTLSKVVNTDMQAVQRHRNTIVDCLKDPDVSIRRRALDLIYSLVNETNIRILVRELLNFLLISDVQFRPELVAKLCMVTEKYAPTKRWHVDTILRVMSIGGNFIPDDVPNNLVTLISANPELQSYAVQKLYIALTTQDAHFHLVQVGLWCVGEFGDLLVAADKPNDAKGDDESISITVSENDVLTLMEQTLRNPLTLPVTRQYALTALMKLTSRFNPQHIARIKETIAHYKTSIVVELQQRSCEYTELLNWSSIRPQVLDRMPAYEKVPVSSDNSDAVSPHVGSVSQPQPPTHAPPSQSLLGDPLGDLFGPTPAVANPTSVQPAKTAAPGLGLMDELFGPGPSTSAPAPVTRPAVGGGLDNLQDLLGGAFAPSPVSAVPTPANPGFAPPTAASPPPAAGAAPGVVTVSGYNKNGISLIFEATKPPGAGQAQFTNLNAVATNSNPFPINNFAIQAAVPKYLQIRMVPPSGNVLAPANGRITQNIKIANSMQGQKPILLKVKIEYNYNGSPINEIADVAFPPTL
jgi:AP-1 complex subunit gamma-1